MNVRFNGTQPVNASAKTQLEVITDYASYPGFNPSVTGVTVLRRDDRGLALRGLVLQLS
jgi:ribosome-associated toxin RatA of RatAB toxin-antitoxin module